MVILNNENGPLVLIIMDGLGIGDQGPGDAVHMAKMHTLNKLIANAKTRGQYTTLETHGEAVGLPEGQMGNSEVGHLTIGSGRKPRQSLPRINEGLAEGTLFSGAEFNQTLERLKQTGGKLHLFGLLSDGGVHSHIDHIIAAAKYASDYGVQVCMHAQLDGRDVDPTSAEKYLDYFNQQTAGYNVSIATVAGRALGMDRDNNWDRIKQVYDAMLFGSAPTSCLSYKLKENIQADYEQQQGTPSDENVKPIVVDGYNGMEKDDAFFVMNFRTDRSRQITQALINPTSIATEKKAIERGVTLTPRFLQSENLQFSQQNALSITELSDELAKLTSVVLQPEILRNGLAETLSKAGLTQLHTAETEKYPHVTFFFNGSIETPFPGEDRKLVASPAVPTYDRKPAMSSMGVTSEVIQAIKENKHDVIIVNFAQPDMVGHTGSIPAVVQSVRAMDHALASITSALAMKNGRAIIIADHGNAEEMLSPSGKPQTKHSTNPVHMVLFGFGRETKITNPDGRSASLTDVSPTMLNCLGLEIPAEMTGTPLVSSLERTLGRASTAASGK